MAHEYVVKEYEKKFHVMIVEHTTVGLWKKREVIKYYQCNVEGGYLFSSNMYYIRNSRRTLSPSCVKCDSFDTIDEALAKIYDFTPKYHKPDAYIKKEIKHFQSYELEVIREDIATMLDSKSLDMANTILRQDIVAKINEVIDTQLLETEKD